MDRDGGLGRRLVGWNIQSDGSKVVRCFSPHCRLCGECDANLRAKAPHYLRAHPDEIPVFLCVLSRLKGSKYSVVLQGRQMRQLEGYCLLAAQLEQQVVGVGGLALAL